jgi:Ca2+/Na+ antiporter
MIGASLLLFPLMKSGLRIRRLEGALLFGLFATYMTLLVLSA